MTAITDNIDVYAGAWHIVTTVATKKIVTVQSAVVLNALTKKTFRGGTINGPQ